MLLTVPQCTGQQRIIQSKMPVVLRLGNSVLLHGLFGYQFVTLNTNSYTASHQNLCNLLLNLKYYTENISFLYGQMWTVLPGVSFQGQLSIFLGST